MSIAEGEIRRFVESPHAGWDSNNANNLCWTIFRDAISQTIQKRRRFMLPTPETYKTSGSVTRKVPCAT